MAQNTSPIFCLTPSMAWATAITAANTNLDGTGTVSTVFTADATNGGFVEYVKFKAAGTNVATVARVFINNGSTNATAANNVLFAELSLAATTASATAATQEYLIPLNIRLPAGYKVNVTLGTAVSAGWMPCAVGGQY